MVVARNWGIGGIDHSIARSIPPGVYTFSVAMSCPNGDPLPRATLLCRPNSHPFQERSLLLSQPIKVGRSVARARVAHNNAIFECKVLSRNHALLWYENGKFFLQDTKSSNGTFVNNQRLSQGGVESQPHELSSGDIVQFGVDVMENTKKVGETDDRLLNVTHGCIIATLKLYLPDGKEAKASQISGVTSGNNIISTEELYQLNQYIQEATQREQQLEGKLGHLQRIVEATQLSAQQAWHCLLQEDRLLTRIDVLESQLQVYSNNAGEDKLRDEILQMFNDKLKYQEIAKESLRHAVEEKLAVTKRNAVLEAALCSAEEDRDNTQQNYMKTQQDLQELASRYNSVQSQMREMDISKDNHDQLKIQIDILKMQVSECRQNELVTQSKLLCSKIKLIMLQNLCKVVQPSLLDRPIMKYNKSETLDNDSYQISSESLLTKVDKKIEQLQKHLLEITETTTSQPINENLNNHKFDTDISEELNDNGSDITVIENETSIINLSNSHSDVSLTSLSNTFSNQDNAEPMNGSVELDNNIHSYSKRVEQIKLSISELRNHRDLLEDSQRDITSYNNEITEEVESPENEQDLHQQQQRQNERTELQSENERLNEVLQCCKQQAKYFENEVGELKQKVETLGIELQARPSYNSYQEKESMCLDQQMVIESLKLERHELKEEIVKCNSVEKDMNERLGLLQKKLNETETIVRNMETNIHEKEQHIKNLLDNNISKEDVSTETVLKESDKSIQTDLQVNGLGENIPQNEVVQAVKDLVELETSIQKDFEFLSDPNVELEEELVLLKEKFATCSKDNDKLSMDLAKLRFECDNRSSQTKTMIFVYLAPLLALICYLILSPHMSSVN